MIHDRELQSSIENRQSAITWPLEELFRARLITFLLKEGLLPAERANMLRGWNHSGFNIHRNQRVAPGRREDMERLAQYIIRNPFWV